MLGAGFPAASPRHPAPAVPHPDAAGADHLSAPMVPLVKLDDLRLDLDRLSPDAEALLQPYRRLF
jgi:hypothetical protein